MIQGFSCWVVDPEEEIPFLFFLVSDSSKSTREMNGAVH